MVAFLDTLHTAKRRREADFAEPQAEALTELLRDAREAGQGQLATKADLGALEVKIDGVAAELNAKIDGVAAELNAKIDRVASELNAKIDRVAAELNARIDRVAAELRAEFALIRSQMEVLRRDLTIRLGSMIVVATGVLLAQNFLGEGEVATAGGGQMPDMLIRLALVAAIAGAAIPAWGAEMPEFGTKNFSPGGGAPSYFTNENGVVSTAAGEAWDDGEDAAIGSASDTNEPARMTLRYHDRVAAHQSKYHSTAYARSSRHTRTAHPAHYATAADSTGRNRSSRTAGVKSIHHAWARPSSRKG